MRLEKWFCVHILTQARNIKDTFPLEMFDISHSILLEQEGEGRQRIESGCVYMCVGAASASVDLNARKVLKSVHPRVGMCVCVCGTTARSETRRFCCPPLWVNLGHTLESGNFGLSNSGSNTCFVIIITSSAPCRILMESKCIVLELFAFVFVWACVCIRVCVWGERHRYPPLCLLWLWAMGQWKFYVTESVLKTNDAHWPPPLLHPSLSLSIVCSVVTSLSGSLARLSCSTLA